MVVFVIWGVKVISQAIQINPLGAAIFISLSIAYDAVRPPVVSLSLMRWRETAP